MNGEEGYADVQAAALGEAVRDAVATGDLTEVHRLVDHMTAEGPAGITRDWLLAVALYRLAREAERQGKPELAAQFEETMRAECSVETLGVLLLDVGRRRGWLYAEEYDHAAELAKRFPDLREPLRRLERRTR